MLKKFKELRKNKKGFTLIELVVVLVIIAILAAITVPVVTGYIEDANNARFVSEAQSIYMVIQTEEAKEIAKNPDTPLPAKFHEGVVDTANTKLSKSGMEVISIVQSGAGETKSYEVKFNSDSKGITATILPNDEITVKTVKTPYKKPKA